MLNAVLEEGVQNANYILALVCLRNFVMAAVNQVTLAKYKLGRLVTPRQMADEYVCIDEVDYQNWPVLTINSSPGNPNDVILMEPRFNFNTFAPGSPLLNAFFENYRYFRCRSVLVTFQSTDVSVDYRRVQVGCYWVPDHSSYDRGVDAPITSWSIFKEKPNTSMINTRGNPSRFHIRYVPQVTKQDEVVEDEEVVPPVIWDVRGDQPMGWMDTSAPFKTLEMRGPHIVFRRPYSPAGGPATPEVSYSITVKTIWEFKKAKNGN